MGPILNGYRAMGVFCRKCTPVNRAMHITLCDLEPAEAERVR
jgi:hypothetical protein